MTSDTKTKEARQRHIAPAATKTQRAAGEETAPALVVTDENVDELCERLWKLPEDSPEYDRLADALHRYVIG